MSCINTRQVEFGVLSKHVQYKSIIKSEAMVVCIV